MDSRLRPSQTLLLGSLVFGLFFGAGNLIFPAQLGREAGQAVLAACAGFLITAVGLPVLGVVASAVSGSRSVHAMVDPVSRRYALFFTCALYLTIGPLFAIPRTATVSFEVGVRPLVGEGGPWLLLFSLAFFAVTAAVALRPGRLMDWIGRYLTPIFLVLLSALVVAALVRPMTTEPLAAPVDRYAGHALSAGLIDGYNTMDALASLAFAIVIVDAARRLGVNTPRRLAVELGKAGVVGGLGMAVVYAALAYIGATSVGAVPEADNGGVLLAATSRHYFGAAGQYLIAAIVLVACLKTSIGLIAACARMFSELGRLRSAAGDSPTDGSVAERSYVPWALGFVLVSFAIANAGLETIIGVSLPVLMFLYPLAIVTIVFGLGWSRARRHLVVVRCTLAFTALAAFFDLLAALPEGLATTPVVTALTGAAGRVLPGFEVGFGWVVPALVGFAVGVALDAAGRTRRTPARSGDESLAG
ncbi:branched-chain amino acid transport system II carrier protein [Mobilicoccus caccae]|uniref:Branched-chain amino acid transport system carrier protein n=1 Tax=Mobilicoccus caccae TaxID=1859295 RepID=A0ABQ6INM5_9MICO|nr:branched-chain amino acid transport system II carrier protein [Mobilicoccus caccae]GMA38818.1 branched-chain amino acid transport system carrier protein [Mobilicoccus caccae]